MYTNPNMSPFLLQLIQRLLSTGKESTIIWKTTEALQFQLPAKSAMSKQVFLTDCKLQSPNASLLTQTEKWGKMISFNRQVSCFLSSQENDGFG